MREEKQLLVERIGNALGSSAHVFLITYKGLTAEAFGSLRTSLAEVDATCHVVPNRLLKRAIAEQDSNALAEDTFAGDTALVTGGDDPVVVAKQLRDFGKGHAEVAFKIAVVDGQRCDAEEAKSIADLPPREILLAQLLGLLQAPARQLVTVLNAKAASIVNVIDAYLRKQEETA